ncbi:MAG: bifunctional ADP-dependent (S)-NAD(P)H-hydrate dehydratase/NAD(P)H-hydrate epimerase [Bellilinea sp.]|nr:MAG: bifunctional ADP-dependent (S)-NAD(P)H-hydrate dehydratase/NAD(P)H-hydrate epimerase [Bellilinea sp.]
MRPIPLVTVDQMRAIEREGDARGVSYAEMMERAGRGVANAVQVIPVERRTVLGLIGSGNNGGDGLVALAYLAEAGWKCRAYLVKARSEEDHLLKRVKNAGIEICTAAEDAAFKVMDEWLSSSEVVLDGVLGTGIQLPLKPEVERVLDHVRNFAPLPFVVAVDCPSGVDCDSGEASPAVIPARLTVCMDAVKTGLLRFPAAGLTGQLAVVPLGLPSDLMALQEVREFVACGAEVAEWLPVRPANAHKGTFGTVLGIAGCADYIGAAGLAAEAAYRAGTGLVRMAVIPTVRNALAGQLSEVTWLSLPEEKGSIAPQAAQVVLAHLERVTALLIGPGLSTSPATAAFVQEFLNHSTDLPPTVVDADGLRLMTKVEKWYEKLPSPSVLTPHPGEMSAMTSLPTAEIQANRAGVARHFASQWGHIVVLKGAFAVVASPDGTIYHIPVASPALARAGSGDVLTGLIAGLLAQGVAPFTAAITAAWVHALAGLIAEQQIGQSASVLAGDILRAVPQALTRLDHRKYLQDPLWVVG